VGTLTLIMLMLSPVSHLHYFVLEIPVIMALVARDWERKSTLTGSVFLSGRAESPLSLGTFAACLVVFIGNILPQLPLFLVLRDRGAAGVTAVLLWIVAWGALRARTNPVLEAVPGPAPAAVSSAPVPLAV